VRNRWLFLCLSGALGACTSDAKDDAPDTDAVANATEDSDPPADLPEATWGTVCTSDAQCTGPVDYCVIQPGDEDGYCATRCENTAACETLGAPDGWTCNTVEFLGCDDVATNWCAPPEELVENGEFLIECVP
jgi:hypothetical protein